MSKYLEKVNNLRKIIKQNNGIIGSFLQLFRTDELKYGEVIGEDKYGNTYFQNKAYFFGRSRWVNYANKYGYDYDASQIPPEWHRWMHYMTDDPPSKVKPCPDRHFVIDHEENLSGTSKKYVPYSTVPPKIHVWNPQEKKETL